MQIYEKKDAPPKVKHQILSVSNLNFEPRRVNQSSKSCIYSSFPSLRLFKSKVSLKSALGKGREMLCPIVAILGIDAQEILGRVVAVESEIVRLSSVQCPEVLYELYDIRASVIYMIGNARVQACIAHTIHLV